eukprot:9725897-Prorocentrum_lima.AAC.1
MGTSQDKSKVMGFVIKAFFVSGCWRGCFRRSPEMRHSGAVLDRPGGSDVEGALDAVFLLAGGVGGSFAQLDVCAG